MTGRLADLGWTVAAVAIVIAARIWDRLQQVGCDQGRDE